MMAYKYVGNGGWMTGIPKRDLTEKDLLDFNIDEKVLVKSGLYEKVKSKKEVKITEITKEVLDGREET